MRYIDLFQKFGESHMWYTGNRVFGNSVGASMGPMVFPLFNCPSPAYTFHSMADKYKPNSGKKGNFSKRVWPNV